MDDMSASTRTIQQPMVQGSILRAVLMATAVLVAAVAITWSATNLVGTKSVATPVQAPIFLDRGGRGDLPKAVTNGNRVKDDNIAGSSYVGRPSSVGASSAAHGTRVPGKATLPTSTHTGLRAQ
jgi:hypothetical protein